MPEFDKLLTPATSQKMPVVPLSSQHALFGGITLVLLNMLKAVALHLFTVKQFGFETEVPLQYSFLLKIPGIAIIPNS